MVVFTINSNFIGTVLDMSSILVVHSKKRRERDCDALRHVLSMLFFAIEMYFR